MTSKRAKNAPTDELDELFEGIGDEKAAPKKTTKASSKAAKKTSGAEPEKDILAELENELEDKQEASRPHTPRVKDIASGTKGSPARKAGAVGTPPPDASITALPRRSAESTKPSSTRNSTDEAPASTTATSGGGGGGWWGGIVSTASAAMKQAEAAVKEIQQNEEAKRWAEQVRGNVTALRGYGECSFFLHCCRSVSFFPNISGDELRHRALPTFTNILHTLAPPISSHERLLIHITHDMVGYPSLDPLVHGVFARVMAQVEGGDLLVIQRGQENAVAGTGAASLLHSAAGWRDGPWWRIVDSPRDLGAVPGLHEGTKLCRASAEAYSNEYYAASYGEHGVQVARQRALEPVSEDNPVRRSDLFLAVQAICTSPPIGEGVHGAGTSALFASSAAGAKEKADAGTDDEAEEAEELVSFAVYVLDPVHEIVYHTVSQALPAKWVRWLDAPALLTPATTTASSQAEEGGAADERAAAAAARRLSASYERIPEDIRDVVESGGVDPREWVAEWVEETLSLAVGVVAQRYVARRMGVGEGSVGKGKQRVDSVLEDLGGEAARAGIL